VAVVGLEIAAAAVAMVVVVVVAPAAWCFSRHHISSDHNLRSSRTAAVVVRGRTAQRLGETVKRD
jgi:hypothetical protein